MEKDGSSASLTAMSDSPGGCLWAGWGTRRQESGGHSRPPLRRVPPVLNPPCDPHYTYLINVGAQKVLGSPKQWGYPNPKVNEEEKDRNEAKPKTPNCPRSFFFGLNTNGRCLFKKVPLYTKVLRKVVNSYKNRQSARRVSRSGGRAALSSTQQRPPPLSRSPRLSPWALGLWPGWRAGGAAR